MVHLLAAKVQHQKADSGPSGCQDDAPREVLVYERPPRLPEVVLAFGAGEYEREGDVLDLPRRGRQHLRRQRGSRPNGRWRILVTVQFQTDVAGFDNTASGPRLPSRIWLAARLRERVHRDRCAGGGASQFRFSYAVRIRSSTDGSQCREDSGRASPAARH
jgi:hypothetical protein